ncbi:MAG TPA: protein translocase subunit SecD [Bryobacteraceae bacterium]|jgi:preprotein translocase subunit SecD|nr:protein translocase subunit SecD [Bryobacteraceae bacterium]
MQTNLTSRSVIIVVVILICVYGVIGFPTSMAAIERNFSSNIHLGLDLKGGSQLVLEVQVQDAVKADAQQTAERLKEDLKKQSVTWASMDVNEVKTVAEANQVALTIKGVPATQSSAFRTAVSESFPTYNLNAINSTDYELKLKPTELLALENETVQRSIDTIGNRIDQLGLAEKSIQKYGASGANFQIMVQLPGLDDPARARELIGKAAVLEIDDVKDGPYPSKDAALAQHGGILPLNTKLVQALARAGSQGEEWYLVSKNPIVSGQEMRNARPSQGEMRGWETDFTLSPDAGKRFGRYTEANINNKLAVVLDNRTVSVATIQAKIEDSGRITGLGSQEEAVDLSRYLRSGSLPAGIQYLDDRTIGPSLGADSIHEGIVAGLAGLIAVIIVMLVYYKRSGINAVLALLLNAVILLAAMAWFGAVLTLPGIAGFILTIGMAVDSNVLIFERIREELRAGKSVVAAVQAGFDKAWWTIVDTHVTTIVSCAFLFLFGEGPVKGFAVTLTIGLAANVFTAVFVSKTIFAWELSSRTRQEAISI